MNNQQEIDKNVEAAMYLINKNTTDAERCYYSSGYYKLLKTIKTKNGGFEKIITESKNFEDILKYL